MTTAPWLAILALAFAPAASPGTPSEAVGAASAPGPAILDFHADWCGPCQQMRPRVDQLVKGRYPVRSIDVDDQPELAERYKVEALPTFVVVDAEGREVARRQGLVEARELADLYREAVGPTPVTASPRPQVRPASAGSTARLPLPDPWATVVRIQVRDRNKLGFGSGTVIESTEDEAIILTCAHIFSVDGRQPRPDQFHRMYPVQVELFDGKLGGPGGQTVRPLGQPMPGEVIDYDFDRDVALVRIRPGRVVPASRVVPTRWKPAARMSMYTVGCSHGEDATAWNTMIHAATTRYQVPGKRDYDAIECLHSPKQGRSGGGLFTEDGYVAGVCNFAFDKSVSRGLYASPKSIYWILDKNGMGHLYEDLRRAGPPQVIAANGPKAGDPAGGPDVVFRGQTPAEDPAVANRGGRMLSVPPIVVPPPEFFDIGLPGEAPEPSPSDVASAPAPSGAAPVPAIGRGSGPVRSGWVPVSPGTASRASGSSGDARSSNRPAPTVAPAATSAPSRPSRAGWATVSPRG